MLTTDQIVMMDAYIAGIEAAMPAVIHRVFLQRYGREPSQIEIDALLPAASKSLADRRRAWIALAADPVGLPN